MPPKKKRKTTAGPGIATTFLVSEYASFDENNPMLCNGHVLYQYVKDENRSIAETVAVIKENHKALDVEKYDVSKIVNRMSKFKQLSAKSNFDSFKSFCAEKFTAVARVAIPTTTNQHFHLLVMKVLNRVFQKLKKYLKRSKSQSRPRNRSSAQDWEKIYKKWENGTGHDSEICVLARQDGCLQSSKEAG